MAAGHPVPDAAWAEAGRAVMELLHEAGAGDRVLALISGGGSALMIAPAGEITLADYARTNELLRAITSGPTVAPIGTREDAARLLQSSGLWDQAPLSVRAHLSAERPAPDLPVPTNHLIGSNRHSLEAMLAAPPKGYEARIASDSLVGDVEEAAEEIQRWARAAKGPAALIFGGETTVQLRGTGRGGRDQELALRVARGAKGVLAPGWVFLSAGTDGRDGPTDAAGAIVDAGTCTRIAQAGGDLDALLRNNDSFRALKLAGDLLLSGGTGTNVADVQVFVRPA